MAKEVALARAKAEEAKNEFEQVHLCSGMSRAFWRVGSALIIVHVLFTCSYVEQLHNIEPAYAE